ncbi:MAG: heme o synthase [Planctomycetales bacterium]|nr:heme o synthase [Planctomycetales bacterium]
MSTSTLAASRPRTGVISLAVDYVELTKPRIAVLVMVVVTASAIMAAWTTGVAVSGWAVFHACLGTLLVASSASAANQWLEIRRDSRMNRTADRPLPAGRISITGALVFAGLTLLVGLVYLAITLPPSALLWASLTWLLYVAVYTPLKPISSANTAVGAVAGALPVFIGWSAVSESLDIRAVALFLTLYLWQFPHFMAIAWLYREDYARGGYKMLPVVDPSGRRAGVQAVLSAAALLPVSAIPALAAPGWGGPLYLVIVTLLGLAQLLVAALFLVQMNREAARRLLRMSLIYLPILLGLLVIVPWLT